MNGTRYRYYDASSHYFMKMIDNRPTHTSNPDGGLRTAGENEQKKKVSGIRHENHALSSTE